VPVLMCGGSARLPCGEAVRVLSYEAGDEDAAVVRPSGAVLWARASSLVTAPTRPPHVDAATFAAVVPALGWAVPAGPGGMICGWDVRRAEAGVQAMRCVAEYAEAQPELAAEALQRAGLLGPVVGMALEAPCTGPLVAAQHCHEECAAAFGLAVRRAAPAPACRTGCPGCAAAAGTRLVHRPNKGRAREDASDASTRGGHGDASDPSESPSVTLERSE
jgi:hypothetical protein